MKSKRLMAAILSAALSISTVFSAFGGWYEGVYKDDSAWHHDGTGWKYWNPDYNTGIVDTWASIDGNGDGIAEYYYFDQNGYLAVNTTVGEIAVNTDGAALTDGNVASVAQSSKTDFEVGWKYGTYVSMFRQADNTKLEITVGWYSDTGEDYLSITSGSDYRNSLFTGVLVPLDSSGHSFVAQDLSTGTVIRIFYNGLDEFQVVLVSQGTDYAGVYAADSEETLNNTLFGNYLKLEDLSHYVS